jgi:hypothetical protein
MKYRTFVGQFHPRIRTGLKVSTIRSKAWCEQGERVALRYWTGRPYRSPMAILGTAVVVHVSDVLIDRDGAYMRNVNTKELQRYPSDMLAMQEGFGSWVAMRYWFDVTYGLPYTGVLTRWDPSTLELDVKS